MGAGICGAAIRCAEKDDEYRLLRAHKFEGRIVPGTAEIMRQCWRLISSVAVPIYILLGSTGSFGDVAVPFLTTSIDWAFFAPITMLSSGEIRLLTLLPASDEQSMIECNIDVAELSGKPDYEALSYVWSGVPGSSTITLSGRPITVSRTLDNALRRLRLLDRKRTLWVDQICIDQQNNEEKMQQ